MKHDKREKKPAKESVSFPFLFSTQWCSSPFLGGGGHPLPREREKYKRRERGNNDNNNKEERNDENEEKAADRNRRGIYKAGEINNKFPSEQRKAK